MRAGLCLDAGFTGAVGSSNAFVIDVSLKEAIQAGFSFDFALNPEYGPFLSEVICRYIAGLQTGARSAA